MRQVKVLGSLLILIYISAESLLVKDNTNALRSAEEGIDRATRGKLAEKLPNTYIGLLSTLSLIGVFAPIAVYLKKYHILLTIYLLVTRWQVFFTFKGPFHEQFYDQGLPCNRFEGQPDDASSGFRIYTDSLVLRLIYASMPPPYVVTTLCLAMVLVKESIDSIYKRRPIQLSREYDPTRLKTFILDEFEPLLGSINSAN